MRKPTNLRIVKLLSLLLTVSLTPLICQAQEAGRNFALLPESWARESSITRVMPIYPEEAVRHGISGVVHIKFETNSEGEVVRVKVKPGTDPLLAKSVAEAVKRWAFKTRPGPDGTPQPVISRLIFSFILNTDETRVEPYNPGPHAKDVQHIGYYNSAKEMREWREWLEVETEPVKP
jgi:TonB family protein